MGLGKTLEVISLIDSLPRDRSYLIVAPTSLIFNWQMEFENLHLILQYPLFMVEQERKKILKMDLIKIKY